MEDIAKEIRITASDKANLTTAAKWAQFLAIASFIMCGLVAVAFLFMLLGVAIAGISIPGMPFQGAAMAVYLSVMLCMMLIYIIPSIYLYRFAQKAHTAVETDNQEAMSESLLNLRRLFKFCGIMVLVSLAAYALFIVIAIIAGVASAVETAL